MAERAQPARHAVSETAIRDARGATATLVDFTERGDRIRELAQLARHGPAAVLQRRALQGMFGPARASPAGALAPARVAAPVVQRVVPGLGDFVLPGRIPGEWVLAFLMDITQSTTHLYEAEIFAYLNAQDSAWMARATLSRAGNHWNVDFTGPPRRIVTTRADGDCGVHAIHAILHEDRDRDPNNYAAPGDFSERVRGWILDHPPTNEEIAKRIAQEIERSGNVAETGFGTNLSRILEPMQEEAARKMEAATPPRLPSLPDDERKGTSERPSAADPRARPGGKVVIAHHDDDGGNIKVVIHDAVTGAALGSVVLQYNHDEKVVMPHTSAASGQGGQGLGGALYQQVMTYLLDKKLIPPGYTIHMAIVGGAMLHLQTRKFSERFGESKGHAEGEARGRDRKSKAEAPRTSREEDLEAFNRVFIPEHLQYLRALAAARRAGKLAGLQISSLSCIPHLKAVCVELGIHDDPRVLSALYAPPGGAILDLMQAYPDYEELFLTAYRRSLDTGKVAVTFALSREILEQFIGFGFANKLGWLYRKYT